MKHKPRYVIGVDPGTHTGYAVYDTEAKKLTEVKTFKVHDFILEMHEHYRIGDKVLVRFEDARLRKWFGNSGREKLQGSGSVKRDSKIVEDSLVDFGISYQKLSPKQKGKKWSKEYFEKVTGWTGRTSEHARDAASLVFGY